MCPFASATGIKLPAHVERMNVLNCMSNIRLQMVNSILYRRMDPWSRGWISLKDWIGHAAD